MDRYDQRRIAFLIGTDIGLEPEYFQVYIFDGKKLVHRHEGKTGPFDTVGSLFRDMQEVTAAALVELEWWG